MHNSKHSWVITFDVDVDHSPSGWIGWIVAELAELRSRNFDVSMATNGQRGLVHYTVQHKDPRAMFLYQLSGVRACSVDADE
jgi:hypothetical protein